MPFPRETPRLANAATLIWIIAVAAAIAAALLLALP